MEFGEGFRSLMPDFAPLFVNLAALAQFVSQGGAFGHVLRLVRDRKAWPEELRRLLVSAVTYLEVRPAAERLRWLELLSYMYMLVYHGRTGPERRGRQGLGL